MQQPLLHRQSMSKANMSHVYIDHIEVIFGELILYF